MHVRLKWVFLCGLGHLLFCAPIRAQAWQPMGPPGGDAVILALDQSRPDTLYLGTTDGHIFGSADGGHHWKLLGRAGVRRDAVITSIVVDQRNSQVLYASSWTSEADHEGGGVFCSRDGGYIWHSAGLAGHAVRALIQSPSDPRVLIAGALDGVFRSENDGTSWKQISPPKDPELQNVDSLAVDPKDSNIIYAGTFHLPWKTMDGGQHWVPIHAGMIDDSDVFSMIVDQRRPRHLFASACSGIYRSDDGGVLWQKIQGVPFSARRTYVIRQDEAHPNDVYAGTTEGLWATRDGGATWRRITPRDWVVNTLAIIPSPDASSPDSIVIGTDQLGVLISDDGGREFHPSNEGFYHRQILALALDQEHSGRVLAVVANAPEPVLATQDAGATWAPLGPGLHTEALKSVYATPDGWLATLSRGGFMRYDAQRSEWLRTGVLRDAPPALPVRHEKHSHAPSSRQFPFVVNDMAFARNLWFAATDQGLFVSRDQGAAWEIFHFAPLDLPVNSVRASPDGRDIRVVSLRGLVFSFNGGQTWSWHDLPFGAGGALWLDRAPDGTLLAEARKGLYISRDGGESWQRVASGLPEVPVTGLALTAKVWLASVETGGLYMSRDEGRSWSRLEGTLAEGIFPVIKTGDAGDTVYAASSTEGLYRVEIAARPGFQTVRTAAGP